MPNSRFFRIIVSLLFPLAVGTAAAAQTLPAPLSEWLQCEQGRMSRSVDQSRLVALTNLQNPRFAPETGNTFTVKSYWVDASKMHSFTGSAIPRPLEELLKRTKDGKPQVRFLIHPESEELYRALVQNAERADDFVATATASSRTLLVFLQGHPELPFFAKVSLDKVIGGVRRTISQGEIVRSVGTNNVLDLAARRSELPTSFGYIPEVFSTIPRGMEEGGMVIRAVPRDLLEGRVRYIPLFSLYSEPKGGGRPLLAEMIARSGLPAEAFVREKIIRPFARQWLELSARRGIIPEPHAQNVLLEVGADNLPTGRFIHRDFGGFHIDFDFRQATGQALPGQMPQISTFKKDYKVGRYGRPEDLVGKNLDAFFYGGFIYNLDTQMPTWAGRGWLNCGVQEGTFKKALLQEIEHEYTAMTGRDLGLKGDLRGVSKMVSPLRSLVPSFSGPSAPQTAKPKFLSNVLSRISQLKLTAGAR